MLIQKKIPSLDKFIKECGDPPADPRIFFVTDPPIDPEAKFWSGSVDQ